MGESRRTNHNLCNSKKAKNDEFYTRYKDIQKEVELYITYNTDVFRNKTILLPCDDPTWSNFTRFFVCNFEKFGIKKLISTCFSPESKFYKEHIQMSFFDDDGLISDKTNMKGKIFVLTKDKSNGNKIDLNNLDWKYLDGDGDFRSNEIKKLRDEADIIITNPPFSLFREFVDWIFEAEKDFLILGNKNAIKYNKIFGLYKTNKLRIGWNEVKFFFNNKSEEQLLGNTWWYTNLEHGRKRQPLSLMTMDDNLKYCKYKEIKNIGYQKYDDYDALDIPYTDAIPSDYEGVMGVPITFLDKYNPEQFEIIGLDKYIYGSCFRKNNKNIFSRILIKPLRR